MPREIRPIARRLSDLRKICLRNCEQSCVFLPVTLIALLALLWVLRIGRRTPPNRAEPDVLILNPK
jgi:hypothetical protein